jgi:ABC-type cobalamin/Fe3+-siderophores transport system ATPase subunit
VEPLAAALRERYSGACGSTPVSGGAFGVNKGSRGDQQDDQQPHITFRAHPWSRAGEHQDDAVTVFVGPNNSGKSQILREIHQYCSTGQRDAGNVIVQALDFQAFTPEGAAEQIKRVTLPQRPGESLHLEQVIVGKRGVRQQVPRDRLAEALQDPNTHSRQFCPWYLSFNTMMLDGRSRIDLVNQQPAGDLAHEPNSSFQVLFRDNAKRLEVRRIVHDAFRLFFAIDPTNLGHFRLRLSTRPPNTELEERGIHDEAVRFHANATSIDQASDGVKAFVGMITEIIAGDPHILLIDEPEAFLHPALSFNLGKEIALASSGSDKRLFVSTHSPTFVMGCIQSGAPINIVRLTYRNGVATARLLPSADLLRLMRNPLLRSTGVISGLFYEFVIVTESDTDRAFYQEINERLLRYQPDRGIPNCLFLNAQNKQTVRTIIRPLRQLGIPAAGIVDIDVLKEGGSVWTDFLSAGFVPELELNSLATLRSNVKTRFDATGREMKRDGGVSLLSDHDAEAAGNLLDRLQQYGLFVVRRGELESWLPTLGATGHGPTWLVEAFERMGEDPEAQDFVRPSEGDVWAFLGSVRDWLQDPARRGIPS